MTIGEILGVMGFILAFLHVGWQVWWQRYQNTERVRADVRVGPKPCIQVRNVGVIPVHVTGVELVVYEGGAKKHFPLQSVLVMQCMPSEAGRLGEEVWQFPGWKTYADPLPRGGKYIFALHKETPQIPQPMASGARPKMWIAVYSNNGEIFRVRTKQVLAYLSAIAAPIQPIERV